MEGEASFFFLLVLRKESLYSKSSIWKARKRFHPSSKQFFWLSQNWRGGKKIIYHPSSMKTITSIHPDELYWLMVIYLNFIAISLKLKKFCWWVYDLITCHMTSNFLNSQMFCQSEQIILIFLGVGVIFEGHCILGILTGSNFLFWG